MNILLVAATEFELQPLLSQLEQAGYTEKEGRWESSALSIQPLVTGVGLTATTYHLTRHLANYSYQLALNLGIAGAFDRSIELGAVFQVISEQFADLGVEEADGRFLDLFQLDLTTPNQPPFTGGKLLNVGAEAFDFLPKATAITVHKVHGSTPSIEAVRQKYPVQLESMEGAAFFYVCLLEQLPFLAIRAVSNYVEPRNRAAWEIGKALDALTKAVFQLLESLREVANE